MATLTEFLSQNKPMGFTPKPYYSAEGDSLTFYFLDKAHYRERIDDFLTVYRSFDDRGLVGCQIKGLPQALELLGDFGLSISDGVVTLNMIFIACMAQSPDQRTKDCYRELAKATKNHGQDMPVDGLIAA
jgi:hypothetical protein